MNIKKKTGRLVLVSAALLAIPLSAGAVAPKVSVAKASAVVTTKAASNVPPMTYTKAKANALCKRVKARPEYKRVVKAGPKKNRGPTRSVTAELCRFNTASKAQQRKYWNSVLSLLVKAGELSKKDKRALSKLIDAPQATIAGWKPATAFGQSLQDRLGEGAGSNSGSGPSTRSTSGDVGTLVGGAVGLLLGENPVSVAIGAGIGRVIGEVVDANMGGGGGGDDGSVDGGDEDGDGDGDGGGDGGGDDGGS